MGLDHMLYQCLPCVHKIRHGKTWGLDDGSESVNAQDVSGTLNYLGEHQKRTGKMVLDGRAHLLPLLTSVLPSAIVLSLPLADCDSLCLVLTRQRSPTSSGSL